MYQYFSKHNIVHKLNENNKFQNSIKSAPSILLKSLFNKISFICINYY